MSNYTMSPEAIEAQRAYKREYYRRNKDKQRAWNRAYWERKAKKMTVSDSQLSQSEAQSEAQ